MLINDRFYHNAVCLVSDNGCKPPEVKRLDDLCLRLCREMGREQFAMALRGERPFPEGVPPRDQLCAILAYYMTDRSRIEAIKVAYRLLAKTGLSEASQVRVKALLGPETNSNLLDEPYTPPPLSAFCQLLGER